MFQYDMLARSLASGNGFRWYAPPDLAHLAPYFHLDVSTLTIDPRGILTTFRAPLYPAFLSLIYSFSGINDGRFLAARLAQAFLAAFLPPLTYFVAKRLFFPPTEGDGKGNGERKIERIARLAAWVVAAYPMFLIFPLALATENLFFLLVMGSVLVLLMLARAATRPDSRHILLYSLLSGFLLGLAALTRSVILPFAALAILWAWFILRLRFAAIFLALAVCATITPWIVRNSLLTHRLTGIETSLGYNLYVGYHPQSTGTFTFGPSLDLLSIINDQARDAIGTQRAIQFIEQNPARFPYLAIRRLGYFFNLELRGFIYFYTNGVLGYIPPRLLLAILLVLALPFVALSLSATFGAALFSWRPGTILLLLLFLGYLLPHVFVLSEERFHLTLVPFFAICAANFWTKGYSALRARGRVYFLVACLVAGLLIFNWGFELWRDGHILAAMLRPDGNQLYLSY